MATRINLQNTPDSTTIMRTPVRFPSGDATLNGILFTPASHQGGLSGVVVTGAWTTVKEQMAGTYARELATQGFAALVFDFKGWGTSEGTPRGMEDPVQKTADIHAAVAFLATRPEVDAARIAGLGVCASSGYMASVAADNAQVSKLALIAPWLHDPALAAQIYGGDEAAQGLIAAGENAAAGETPTLMIAASSTNEQSLMFQAPYYTETDRGLIAAYDNVFNVASWKPWLTYDAQAVADRLRVPTLVVCSEAAALPVGAHAFVERTDATVTERWLDDVNQFDFYDRKDVVDSAVAAVVQHLR